MSLERSLFRWSFWVLVYLLAAPIYIVKWLLGIHKLLGRFDVVRSGVIPCPHCKRKNSLNTLASCRRCGTTEFGSRLFCSNCHQVVKAFACDFCSATVRVL